MEELSAWQEWRRRCAFALLEDESRDWLWGVVASRFRTRLRKLSALGVWDGATSDAPGDRECAHLFETYLQLHQRQDGKSYKHWLLTRGRQDLNTVQSGLMLLIRNVVKDWITHTHPRTAPVSLQKIMGQDLTLEQCLPGDIPEERSSLQEWVEEQEEGWAAELTPEEKRMLAIRAKGWVFSGSRSLAVAGMGKTKLHQLHRDLLSRWAERLQADQPGVAAAEAAAVLMGSMDRVGETFFHLLTENPVSAAFKEAKDPHGD